MTHLTHGDSDLHHEDGSHRSTPISTSGTALANHERRLRAHLVAHGITTSWTPGGATEPDELTTALADQVRRARQAQQDVNDIIERSKEGAD